ncbi:MAG: N-acetylmuramoyl-L-alanine amidase [Gemmatimonadota bacterium]
MMLQGCSVGRWAVTLSIALLLLPLTASGQDGRSGRTAATLQVEREDGSLEGLPLTTRRGYATLSVSTFRDLGWTVDEDGDGVTLRIPDRATATFRVGSPFFRWDGRPFQLVDVPYREDGQVHLPAQVVTDVFPEHLPEYYDYDTGNGRLRAGDPSRVASEPTEAPPVRSNGVASGPTTIPIKTPEAPALTRPGVYDGVRVVWIDAGHGGADPGAIGHGVREKDVALGVARRLADVLKDEPRIEVRMTRDDDGFVELWERGLLATDAKGERPGVFVSIHANSFPARRTTRGFETYFLSEARTEDERRVSAVENAPLTIRGRGVDASRQSDLDFILRELRNFDHAHWSALLAGMVQDELGKFHPGPNRGVKQAPLAVLTNAIMPSVLVEVGFVTNEAEARLMTQAEFQDRTARGIADAVMAFLERYPPGSGLGGSR